MPEVELSAVAGAQGGSQRAATPGPTILAAEDAFEGRLLLGGNGELQGRFKGTIESEGELLIGAGAEVEAAITGTNVTVAGLVRGNVTAAGRLKITASGRLEGDAIVGKLVVQEGGVHHGRIMVHPEGLPSRPPGEGGRGPSAPVELADPGGAERRTSPIEAAKKLWGELF